MIATALVITLGPAVIRLLSLHSRVALMLCN
ncbi:photosystem II reaction center protein Ycf12 [Alteromonas sp. ALT199]|nr:photosystem II reaction center protein Ycf12 [Alteromonas sp. ALT199]